VALYSLWRNWYRCFHIKPIPSKSFGTSFGFPTPARGWWKNHVFSLFFFMSLRLNKAPLINLRVAKRKTSFFLPKVHPKKLVKQLYLVKKWTFFTNHPQTVQMLTLKFKYSLLYIITFFLDISNLGMNNSRSKRYIPCLINFFKYSNPTITCNP
jgi:hypothetical protein